jgi:hypothetical protein
MKKEEWEKQHNYTDKHNCLNCAHSVDKRWSDDRDINLHCKEKEKAKAGSKTKCKYCCDLWQEKEEKYE